MNPHKLLMMKHSDKGCSSVSGTMFYIPEDISEYIDSVILAPRDYKEIFGVERRQAKRRLKRLAVVKISFHGRSINRRYYGDPNLSGTDYCALNYSSLNELVTEDPSEVIGHEVELKKGNVFAYYWNNPKASVRMSMRLGCLSLFLGIIALAISLLSLFA